VKSGVEIQRLPVLLSVTAGVILTGLAGYGLGQSQTDTDDTNRLESYVTPTEDNQYSEMVCKTNSSAYYAPNASASLRSQNKSIGVDGGTSRSPTE
jgi:hypothetical protein